MNFGALDGPAYDHTGYDALQAFDPASLQHEGETALALARHFGDLDLWDLHREDVVYFDVVGGLAVVYAQGLVLPFVALAAAVFAVRRGRGRPPPAAHAAWAQPWPCSRTVAVLGSRCSSWRWPGVCIARRTSSASGARRAS